MGVEGLRGFVKQKAGEFCHREHLSNFLPNSASVDGKIRVVVDGNNFAFEVLRQSRAHGTGLRCLNLYF